MFFFVYLLDLTIYFNIIFVIKKMLYLDVRV